MADACASRWLSRTPTGSGCRTSAFRPSIASSTTSRTSSASGSSCRRSRSWRSCLPPGAPLLTLESQTPVGEFDIIAFSVSFEWDYVNVLTLLRLAGMPALRGRAPPAPSAGRHRRRRHVRQPRAAGAVRRRDRGRRGRGAGARRCARAVSRRHRSRRPAAPARAASAASTSRRSTSRTTAMTARWPGTRRAGAGSAAAGAESGAEDDRRGRSAGDQHLHARHRVRIAVPDRGRARLREPVPLLLGRLQLPARPAVSRPTASCELARSGAAAREPRRPGVDRALRPPGHRAHPRAAHRDGLRDQPGLAAPRRPHRADRPRAARERRAHDHDRARDRLRSPAPRHQQDGDQRRDPRPRRSDLRERHREPEALLHDRPPHRNRRRPGGDSRSDAADARPHAEARAPDAAASAASSAASTR